MKKGRKGGGEGGRKRGRATVSSPILPFLLRGGSSQELAYNQIVGIIPVQEVCMSEHRALYGLGEGHLVLRRGREGGREGGRAGGGGRE